MSKNSYVILIVSGLIATLVWFAFDGEEYSNGNEAEDQWQTALDGKAHSSDEDIAFQVSLEQRLAVKPKQIKVNNATNGNSFDTGEHDATDSDEAIAVWQDSEQPLYQLTDEFANTEYQVTNVLADMQVEINLGDKVTLPLPNGEKVTVEVTGERLESNGDYTWEGMVIGQDGQYPVVITQGENGTFGSIASEQGTYTLTTIDGQNVVYKNPVLPESSDDDFLVVPIIDK